MLKANKTPSPAMTVLLVEDDPEDVELTLTAMNDAFKDATIVIVRDGVEALEYLLNKTSGGAGHKPDLIVLDINLPKINGIEVLKRLNAQWGPGLRDLKIAVLSSAPVEQYRSTLKKLGVKLQLQKPIGQAQSAVMVEELTKLIYGDPIRP